MKFSTLFKHSTLCVAIFAVAMFCFSACGGYGRLPENPAETDVVIGNGGLAVQKGDYLYFVNGYLNTSDVGDTNNEGKVTHSAIYRVKLDAGKVVEKNPTTYYEDGCADIDETQALENIDIIVSKVAGFEYSNLYIFGDYIYFTTPNHLKNKEQEVLSSKLNFYRTKLDRSGSLELIYSTNEDNSNVKMTMYEVDGVAYQIIVDGSVLKLFAFDNNKRTENTLSEKANEVALPSYQNSNDVIYNIDRKIYFTENMEDGKTGTILKAYDLATKETSNVFNNEEETYSIKGTSGNYLYYTKATATNPGLSATIYALNADYFTNKVQNTPIQVSAIPVSSSSSDSPRIASYSLVSADLGPAILYYDGTNTYFKRASDNSASLVASSANLLEKLVEVKGDEIYYIADSTLKKINYTQTSQTAVSVIPTTDTPKADITANFDVDGNNVFYLVQHNESHYYLHYTNSTIATDGEPETPYNHFVGVLLEEDYLEVEEHEHEE